MNERIKELSGQAWLHARAIYGDYLTDSGKANHDFFDTFDKKFAELIVQECIAQCEKNAEHSYLGPGSKLSAFNIKEHFGVEE